MRPHPPDPDRLTPRERYRLEVAKREAKVQRHMDRLMLWGLELARPFHRQRVPDTARPYGVYE